MREDLAYLDKQGRRALEVLSVLYRPVSESEFRAAFRRHSKRERGLSNTLSWLINAGLVEKHKQKLICSRSCSETVMLNLARATGFSTRARAILGSDLGFDGSWAHLRVGLYSGSKTSFRQAANTVSGRDLIVEIAAGHSDPGWLDHFPFAEEMAEIALPGAAVNLRRVDATLDWVARLDEPSHTLAYLWGQHFLLRGNLGAVSGVREAFPSLGGWGHVLEGDFGKALELFDKSELAQGNPFGNWPAFLYWSLLVRSQRPLQSHVARSTYTLMCWVDSARRGTVVEPSFIEGWLQKEPPLSLLPAGLALRWLGFDQQLDKLRPRLEQVRAQAEREGFAWVERELAALLGGESTPLTDLLPRQEVWQRSLELLRGLGHESQPAEQRERLIWTLNPRARSSPISARIQKRSRRGWSSGRQVQPDQLWWNRSSCLTDLDNQIVASLYRRDSRSNLQALRLLVGHPLVFLEGDFETPIELVEGRPALVARRRAGSLELRLEPQVEVGARLVLEREAPTRFRFLEVDEGLRKLAAAVGSGLSVPGSEQGAVTDILRDLAVRVDLRTDLSLDLEEVPADPTLQLHLKPEGEGLAVSVSVQPLGSSGPSLRAGSRPAVVASRVQGRPVQAIRDLKAERSRVQALVKACPSIPDKPRAFVLESPLDCLELLEGLTLLEEGTVALHWPAGQPYRVKKRADWSSLQLRLGSGQSWFEVDGELPVDEDRVLQLRELLELAEGGRFVPLGEGEFLALSESFRQRLRQLADLDTGRSGALRLGQLAASVALEDVPSSDLGWQAQVARLREARSLEPPVPEGFRAELRAYQLEGFRWLARLAHWGAGACLADDMGLGKTVQSLALILHRSRLGPSLVVAPTSVLGNWLDEASRFAPGLRVISLGEADRAAALENLQPGDLVVASYGILVRESEALRAQEWATLVLDEAQAIKNPATQRFQAAVQVQAGFRLATTGTPLENHLGELWALFRFLNPGLLGSLKRFSERFQNPIEKGSDNQARERLRTLIRPFILRRTKDEVLKDLPGKTEITLRVELGADERAFYESVRRRAVEQLAQPAAQPGEQTIRVLAELMRLRRACCHPQLVLPEASVPAAKLRAFLRLLDELLDGGHRALVFSQFVDFLGIVRQALDERGVAYQYLDGSTPAVARRRRVEAFQSGEAPVFLISLKAGGVGLNLTAADYVVHLDPWWNPAVEDQASDRAHRLGQTRPVTIYRLVCAHTVEERIVELHRTKRELAEGVLSGTDGGSRMSTDELLALLREEDVPVAIEDSEEDLPAVVQPPSEETALRTWIQAEGQISTGQVMERYSLPRPRAKAMLERMVERGELRRIGDRGRWVRYEAR